MRRSRSTGSLVRRTFEPRPSAGGARGDRPDEDAAQRARPIRGGQALPPLHLATQLDDAYRTETCHKFHNARPWSSVGVAPGRQLATRYAIGSARTVAMR